MYLKIFPFLVLTIFIQNSKADFNNRHQKESFGTDCFMLKKGKKRPVKNFTAGGKIVSSPAIAKDGTIVVGSGDGNIYFFNPDGTQKHPPFTTGGSVYSSAAIAKDGSIVIGSNDKNVYFFNPNGTQKHLPFTTGGRVFSSPAIAQDGTIVVGSEDGKIYFLNPDGSQKHPPFTTGGAVLSSPAIAQDGTIVVTSEDGKIYFLNPDGTQKQVLSRLGWPIYLSPAITQDGTIVIGNKNGQIYFLNTDGTQKHPPFTTGEGVASSPAIAQDGTIVIGSTDGKIFFLNTDGTQKHSPFTTGGRVSSSLAIAQDGTIVVGSDDKKIYFLNPDGTQKHPPFTTGGAVFSSPAIAQDGTIVVGSNDKKIYFLNPDGTQKKFTDVDYVKDPLGCPPTAKKEQKTPVEETPEQKQQALLSKNVCHSLIPQVSKDYEDKVSLAKTLVAMFNHFLQQSATERTTYHNKIGAMKVKEEYHKALEGHLQKEASVNNYTPCPDGRRPTEKRIKEKTLVQLSFDIGGAWEYSLADGTEPLDHNSYKAVNIGHYTLENYNQMAKEFADKKIKKVRNDKDYDCEYSAKYSPGIEMVCQIPGTDVETKPLIETSLAQTPTTPSQYSFLKMTDRILTHTFKSGPTTRDSKCKETLEVNKHLNVPDFKDKTTVVQSEKVIQGCIANDNGRVCLEFTPEQLKDKYNITLEEVLKANHLPLDLGLGKGVYMLKKLEGICKMDQEALKLDIKRGVKGLESDPDLQEKNINRHPFAPTQKQ